MSRGKSSGRPREVQVTVTYLAMEAKASPPPPPSPLLETASLYDVDLLLISHATRTLVPRTGPVPFRSLAKLPLILPGKSHSIRMLVDKEAQKAGIDLDVVLEIEGTHLTLELVQLGHGYTVLPIFPVQRSSVPRRLQLNEIVSPRLKRSMKLVVSKQHPSSFLMRETASLIRQSLLKNSERPKS